MNNSNSIVIITYFGILIFLSLAISGCNYLTCNYKELTEKEYKKIAELNRNAKLIDTMYNDGCLKGFFHVYLRSKSADLEVENEIAEVIMELRNENMERSIWVFNNEGKFLYRSFYLDSTDKIVKLDYQYPNE